MLFSSAFSVHLDYATLLLDAQLVSSEIITRLFWYFHKAINASSKVIPMESVLIVGIKSVVILNKFIQAR